MRLQDKVCLITGGAAGIGRATAERFAEEGAKVVICDVNEDKGRALVAELGDGHRFDKLDITDTDATKGWVDDVVAAYGRVDVIVNNAGIVRDGQLVKHKNGEVAGMMSEADFDLVIAVNLKGVFNGAQAVVPHMIKQGGGVIVNASSVVGRDGNFGQTNYVATKAGVIGMTKVWARELGRKGVRVNAVAPGFIGTDMVMAMPEKVRDMMAGKAPMQRLGRPEEIADAYAFLASNHASFINGAVLSVDGGLTL